MDSVVINFATSHNLSSYPIFKLIYAGPFLQFYHSQNKESIDYKSTSIQSTNLMKKKTRAIFTIQIALGTPYDLNGPGISIMINEVDQLIP